MNRVHFALPSPAVKLLAANAKIAALEEALRVARQERDAARATCATLRETISKLPNTDYSATWHKEF